MPQTQQEPAGTAPLPAPKLASLTVSSVALERPRQVHAGLLLVVPALGTLVAVWWAATHGVSSLDLVLFIAMHALTMIGITVGYHRHYTHLAFKTTPALRFVLGVLGSMACQGSLNYWVGNHRRHHRFTDREGDVHSPHVKGRCALHGWARFWHSHVGWTFTHEFTNTAATAPDLIRDPIARRVTATYYHWVLLGFALPAAAGGLLTASWQGAFTGLLWGGLVRLFVTYHTIQSITSVSHLWGSQAFKTDNESRNNAWLALPTWGESWHNNHHAHPESALLGFHWWQADPGAWVIRLLRRAGLIWDVRMPTAQALNGDVRDER